MRNTYASRVCDVCIKSHILRPRNDDIPSVIGVYNGDQCDHLPINPIPGMSVSLFLLNKNTVDIRYS